MKHAVKINRIYMMFDTVIDYDRDFKPAIDIDLQFSFYTWNKHTLEFLPKLA